MEQDCLKVPEIPLGEVIAERRFTLYETSGAARQVVVRIGKPVPFGWKPFSSDWVLEGFQCPFSIIGLDRDEKITALPGNDAMDSLQYAINVAGHMLDRAVRRLNLINPLHEVRGRNHPGEHSDAAVCPDWIFRYDSQPDRDYGLMKRKEAY